MPKRLKKKRPVRDDAGEEVGWEEYYDFTFPEEEKKALMARIDPGTGLLKVGAEGGAIHPRGVAGASYLIIRIVCDAAETRVRGSDIHGSDPDS